MPSKKSITPAIESVTSRPLACDASMYATCDSVGGYAVNSSSSMVNVIGLEFSKGESPTCLSAVVNDLTRWLYQQDQVWRRMYFVA